MFVDAAAFYAATDRRDGRNQAARDVFALFELERRPLFTSNLVVAEAHALMVRRLGGQVAWRWLESLDLNLVLEDKDDHVQAAGLLARYADKDFSYADAVSFVLMERLRIATAFTFDEHFRQYGLPTLP